MHAEMLCLISVQLGIGFRMMFDKKHLCIAQSPIGRVRLRVYYYNITTHERFRFLRL